MQPQWAAYTGGHGLHRLDETHAPSQGQGKQVDDASHLSDGHDRPGGAGIRPRASTRLIGANRAAANRTANQRSISDR